MKNTILTLSQITAQVKPVASKYNVQAIYLFGSYARGDATAQSDLDFLVIGGDSFKLTQIFSLAEDLRAVFGENVDVFEINEVNTGSDFYREIMRERKLVA